jgi:hypothetical protein
LSPPPEGYTLPFTDVPASAREELALLAYHEIASGTASGTFAPNAFASRGQIAKLIALTLDPATPSPWAPIPDYTRTTRTTVPVTTTSP